LRSEVTLVVPVFPKNSVTEAIHINTHYSVEHSASFLSTAHVAIKKDHQAFSTKL